MVDEKVGGGGGGGNAFLCVCVCVYVCVCLMKVSNGTPTTFILTGPGRPRAICFYKGTACKACFIFDELAATLGCAKLLSPENIS